MVPREKRGRKNSKSLTRGKRHCIAPKNETQTKNRFRFKNLGDQIESISFDQIQGYGSRKAGLPGSLLPKPDEGQSWFGLCLGEWRELNSTAPFASFFNTVQPLSTSLSQLVFFKDDIIESLLKHLRMEKSELASAPLAALSAALSKDLGNDFVAYFPSVFEGLLGLLDKLTDIDSLKVFLGSMFYLIKIMMDEISADQMLNMIVNFCLNIKLRAEIEDFLAEFCCYILSKSFEEKNAKIVFALGPAKVDLLAGILAGACETVCKKKKNLNEERVIYIFSWTAEFDYVSELCFKFILSLIDRNDPTKVWEIISVVLGQQNCLVGDYIARTIINLSSIKRGKLLAAHETLVKALASCNIEPSLFQHATACLLSQADISTALRLRSVLQESLNRLEGICHLLFLCPTLIEPLIGTLQAVQTLQDALRNSHFSAVEAIFRLLESIKSNATLFSQACARIDKSLLFTMVKDQTIPFFLSYRALLILKFCNGIIDKKAVLDANMKSDSYADAEKLTFLSIFADCMEISDIKSYQNFLFTNIAEVNALKVISYHSSLLCDPVVLYVPLCSTNSERRLTALFILHSQYLKDSSLIKELIALESIPYGFNCDREKGIKLQTIGNILKKRNLVNDLEVSVTACALIGNLLFGFSPLQKELYSCLDIMFECYQDICSERFKVLFEQLFSFMDSFSKSPLSTFDAKTIIDQNNAFDTSAYNIVLSSDSMFATLSVNSLFSYFAASPLNLRPLGNTILPYMDHIFGISTDHQHLSPSPWFCSAIQSSLENILTALGGLSTFKNDSLFGKILRGILNKFIASGEPAIQKKALESVFALSLYPGIGLYRERLLNLCEEKTLRDELVNFSSEQDILREDETKWRSLLPIMIKILYGRLVSRRKTRSGKNSLVTRRKLIFNFISTWDPSSLNEFILYLGEMSLISSSIFADEKIIGLLNVLEQFSMKVGKKIEQSSIDIIFGWLVKINTHSESSAVGKKIQNLILKNLFVIYSICPSQSLSSWNESSWSIISPRVSKLHVEFYKEPSTLLNLLQLWSESAAYMEAIFMGYGKEMWIHLLSLLNVQSASDLVSLQALNILDHLLKCGVEKAEGLIDLKVLFQALNARVKSLFGAERPNIKLLDCLVAVLLSVAERNETIEEKMELINTLVVCLDTKKWANEETKTKLIKLLCSIHVPSLNPKVTSVALSLLSANDLKSLTSRYALAGLFKKLSISDPSISFFSEVFSDLHAPSKERIGEYDYALQTSAFERLRQKASDQSLTVDQWVPIIHALLFFANDEEDTAARIHSFRILTSIVRLAREDDKFFEILVIKHLYRGLRLGLKNKSESVRYEFLLFWSTLVDLCQDREPFSLLVPLLGGQSEEANFFHNLLHLQIHRRSRALRELRSFALSSPIPVSLIEDTFIPILHHFILADPAGRDPVPANVVQEAVLAAASLISKLRPKAVITRIKKYSDLIKKAHCAEKALLRLISSIFADLPDGLLSYDENKRMISLFSDLLVGRGKSCRPGVAVALAALLRTLPTKEEMLCHVPKLVASISTLMTSKHVQKRQDSRNTLLQVVENLGLDNFSFVLKELRSLLSSGYYSHLLAFALHFLLTKLDIPMDVVASFAEISMRIICHDHFGPGRKDKQAKEWTGRMEEIRENKSPASLEILASTCSLDTLVNLVLFPLRDACFSCSEVEYVSELCQAFEKGVSKSKICVADLYTIVPILINTELGFYQSNSKYGKLHVNRFVLIGFNILLNLLKRPESKLSAASVDSFMPFIIRYLNGSSIPLMTCAIKCMFYLCQDNFGMKQTLAPYLSNILTRLFALIVETDVKRQSELVASCFRLISVMVRDNEDLQLTESQIKALLSYITMNLETDANQATTPAYSLVSTILRRKVLLPEVFDLVKIMQRTMLRSFYPAVREQCRSAVQTFILSYPLAAGKIQEHFGFITANLEFEVDGGRESMALYVGGLVDKLSWDIFNNNAEAIFVALSARLVNEESENVIAAVENAFSRLVKRFDDRLVGRVITLIDKWLSASSIPVQQTAWMATKHLFRHCTKSLIDLKKLVIPKISPSQAHLLRVLNEAIIRHPCSFVANHLVSIYSSISDEDAEVKHEVLQAYLNHLSPKLDGIEGHKAPDAGCLSEWCESWLSDLRESPTNACAERIVTNILFIARMFIEMGPISDSVKIHDLASLLRSSEKNSKGSRYYNASLMKLYAAIMLLPNIELEVEHCRPVMSTCFKIQELSNKDDIVLAGQILDMLKVQLGENTFETLKAELLRNLSEVRKRKREDMKKFAIKDQMAHARRKLEKQRAKKLAASRASLPKKYTK